MTDAARSFTNFERNQCQNEQANTAALVGDMMVCKSSNQLLRQQSSANDMSFLPSHTELLSQLSEAPHGPRCEAPTHQKRGPLEVTIDEYGEMFEVKGKKGEIFTKTSDGKWNHHLESGADEVVENLKVDCNGNMNYDYIEPGTVAHGHREDNADGSKSITKADGKFVYDKDGHLVEAPAGEGHSRKFHYTDGQLDQIDGRLGHWDRVQKNGQVSWVNKDSGAVWAGDFRLEPGTNFLEFRGQNGAAWAFTPWGTDINQASDNK